MMIRKVRGTKLPSSRSVLIKIFLAHHYYNSKHVRVSPGAANIDAYFQHTGLPGCFVTCQPA